MKLFGLERTGGKFKVTVGDSEGYPEFIINNSEDIEIHDDGKFLYYINSKEFVIISMFFAETLSLILLTNWSKLIQIYISSP